MARSSNLYEQDFYAWTQEQSTLLKAGQLMELDFEHLAGEVESMGISERRELESRLKVLLQHLLKWRFQPEARSNSWMGSIDEQRYQLEVLLRQSPSLRRWLDETLAYAYPAARRSASRETGLPPPVFPERCPFTADQVLDNEFWPE